MFEAPRIDIKVPSKKKGAETQALDKAIVEAQEMSNATSLGTTGAYKVHRGNNSGNVEAYKNKKHLGVIWSNIM